MRLSKITRGLMGQPMFGLMARANELERAGKKIIHFEIGDPDFDSPAEVVQAAADALKKGMTHYTNSMGIRELREELAELVAKDLGFKPEFGQVVVIPANSVIDFTIRCVADPGDEVIMPDPGFPTYISVASYAGMKTVGIPLKEKNQFRMDPEDIRKAITKNTRLIIINSPNNPTGAVIKKDEIMEIGRIAAKHGIFLLSDEVYSKIIYSGRQYSPSALDHCKDHTIVLHSMSKTYAMSGWRIGYAVGPKELIAKMGLLMETIMSCLPAFTQIGAIAAIKKCDALIAHRVGLLKERRDRLVKGLNSLPGVSCLEPEGAYYVFPNIKATGMTSHEFSDKMLEAGVCVLPADCFGSNGEGYVRLSYASTSLELIDEAISKMKQALEKRLSKRRALV